MVIDNIIIKIYRNEDNDVVRTQNVVLCVRPYMILAVDVMCAGPVRIIHY